MERLQFIVRELNKLLGTSYNLLSFDALGPANLLGVIGDVFHALGAGPKIQNQDPSEATITILSVLQSIKYAPPDLTDVNDFCNGFISGDVKIIYPLLEWLLTNQIRIKRRAYLAKFANKIQIPLEAKEDGDVMQTYKNYEKTIGEFWLVYKDDSSAKKESLEAIELKNDIKKMRQDIRNLKRRNKAQWEKLRNVPNKENLVYMGKSYRICCLESRNLTKQVKESLELVTNLEFKVKKLEDKWLRRGRYPLAHTDILQMMEEEARLNKILFESQLPQEFQIEQNLVNVLEETIKTSGVNRDCLRRSVNKSKNDVQELMNEKLNLYSSAEDKLGPFRKQAASIAQKKMELSNDIKDVKAEIGRIDENVREKEIILFNVVGGEVLHGDELRQFIATLREKSGIYKQLRVRLQSISAEQGIENRTLDVLKIVDPTIENAYFNANVTPKEEYQRQFLNNTSEAKQICKQFMQEIDSLKTTITKTHKQLTSARKEFESIKHNLDRIKDVFENATRTDAERMQQLKDEIRETQNDIDILEKTWKTTTQSLDKSEYIFNRLIDEMINDSDQTVSMEEDSYLAMLDRKKEENQVLLQQAQEAIRKLEENKKEEREIVEFFKYTEYLILQKFEDDEE